mmetsp:Transcript_25134/g.68296  ORF Transcript_25134/g.68296 Transcript_25134/m.68296 type:complete len:228 (-) Transcript_25134:333-1016(-)
MDVEAGVAQLRNFLGQQLHAVDRVAKDNGLVDAQLGEECVEAVDFLLLLHKCIVLRDTLQGELVHEVHYVWLVQPPLLEVLDSDWEGGGVEHDLPVSRQEAYQLLDDGLKFRGQQLVSLVHAQHPAVVQLCHALVGQVQDAPGCGHDDVDGGVEAHDVVFQACATRGDHDLHVQVLAHLLAHLGSLEGQLSRGHQDEGLDGIPGGVHLLQHWDTEGCCLAGSVLGAG